MGKRAEINIMIVGEESDHFPLQDTEMVSIKGG